VTAVVAMDNESRYIVQVSVEPNGWLTNGAGGWRSRTATRQEAGSVARHDLSWLWRLELQAARLFGIM